MKAGVVFSGGGARGIAHLGVLKSILEHDIEVEEISGTSAGSIVGALYGLNYSPEDILEMIIQTNFFRFIRPSFSVSGLLSMDKIADLLAEYIKEDNFDALDVPLTITTTDLTAGKTRYISEGELIRPIMCSSCVPVIFKPIQFQGSYYIDGGVLNNLPVEPIRDNNEFIIGSHCNPISDNFSASNMKNLLERSMLIAINSNSIRSKELCDLVIEPKELENISGFDIKKAKKMFTDGYDAANRTLDEYLTLKKPA